MKTVDVHILAKASPSRQVYTVRKDKKVYIVRFHNGIPHIVEKGANYVQQSKI
jgi:hypothetical protein